MENNVTVEKRFSYESPRVDIVLLQTDIITESHIDRNMGEWDTDL